MLAIFGALTVTYAVWQWLRMIVECIVQSGLPAAFAVIAFVWARWVVFACFGQRASLYCYFCPHTKESSQLSNRQEEPASQKPISNEWVYFFPSSHHYIVLQRRNLLVNHSCKWIHRGPESVSGVVPKVLKLPSGKTVLQSPWFSHWLVPLTLPLRVAAYFRPEAASVRFCADCAPFNTSSASWSLYTHLHTPYLVFKHNSKLPH